MRREALLFLCACGSTPDWVQPTYGPTARAEAIQAAATDHECPIDQVHVRCDATTTTSATHGRTVVYDDGPVGTIVDDVPQWELELEVCGHVRRYGHDATERAFVERDRRCEAAACLSLDPPCRSVARETWWPIAVSSPPAFCDDAPIDDRITVAVEANRLEVVFANASTRRHVRWFSTACEAPSVFVAIDDEWFAICGSFDAADRHAIDVDAGSTQHIASGLALGRGTHRIEVIHREPSSELGGQSCSRSGPLSATVSAAALMWAD